MPSLVFPELCQNSADIIPRYLPNKPLVPRPLENSLTITEEDLQSKLDKERRTTLISLNKQQQSTLDKIRKDSPRSDIPWSDIIDLLNAIGGKVSEYDDRVFLLISHTQESKCGVLHRRKRQKNASPSTIKDLQDLLTSVEMEP